MLCILSKENDPLFNLAAEEYLFRNFEEDVFFLYINSPAVVVGKHQNALAEINPGYVWKNKIDVVRRLSGGGAVYHDLGNLNFSFHQSVADTAKISFQSFNQPIVDVLQSLGVPAKISKRNDIFVNGFKVSGHAEHVFRNRILSHGTLLFNAEREKLSKALKNDSGQFSHKAIQSVRSKVANITDFLKSPLSMQQFVQQIFKQIVENKAEGKVYELTATDHKEIIKLAKEKYATWDWNFGYSPKYRFDKTISENKNAIGISVWVEKGMMNEITFVGDGLNEQEKRTVRDALLNSPHKFDSIERILSTLNLNTEISSQLLKCFF